MNWGVTVSSGDISPDIIFLGYWLLPPGTSLSGGVGWGGGGLSGTAMMQEMTGERAEQLLHAWETNCVACVTVHTLWGLKAAVCVRSPRAKSHFTFSSFCSSPWLQGEIQSFNIKWHLQSKAPAYLLSQTILVIFANALFDSSTRQIQKPSPNTGSSCVSIDCVSLS